LVNMSTYKFDRTSFRMMTFEEAEKQHIFERDVPPFIINTLFQL
jgi:hypothetical protein